MEEDDDEDNEEDFIPYHGGIGQAGLGIGGMGRGGIGRGGMGRGGIGRGGFAGHQLPPPLGNIMGRYYFHHYFDIKAYSLNRDLLFKLVCC